MTKLFTACHGILFKYSCNYLYVFQESILGIWLSKSRLYLKSKSRKEKEKKTKKMGGMDTSLGTGGGSFNLALGLLPRMTVEIIILQPPGSFLPHPFLSSRRVPFFSPWVSFLVSLSRSASAARPSPSGLSLWSARCPSSLCPSSSMSCASYCSRAPTNLLWSSTGSPSLAAPLAMALTPTNSSSTLVQRCAALLPPPPLRIPWKTSRGHL